MNRYKLKKELPTFRIGDEFALPKSGGLWLIEGYDERGDWYGRILAYSQSTLDKFPNILKDWFEEILESPKTVDDLEGNMQCWVIDDDAVWCAPWCDVVDAVDKRRIGRIALTKEDANKELVWCKARQTLLRDTKGFKPNLKECDFGWAVYYDPMDVRPRLKCNCGQYADGSIRFSSVEDARASIGLHEKEWLTYLGIEERQ